MADKEPLCTSRFIWTMHLAVSYTHLDVYKRQIWMILTQSLETFKGGHIWEVIQKINGALMAIGLALLVLFFVVGVVKTCTNFSEVKRPEQALKLFLRFAIARGLVVYGMEIMMAIFKIIQGITSTIMTTIGIGSASNTVLPQEIIEAVEDCGFLESIPLWAVSLLGSIFITILAFVMILTVYGRFFKLYMYTAISPVPLSCAAGETTQSVTAVSYTHLDVYKRQPLDRELETALFHRLDAKRCAVCGALFTPGSNRAKYLSLIHIFAAWKHWAS